MHTVLKFTSLLSNYPYFNPLTGIDNRLKVEARIRQLEGGQKVTLASSAPKTPNSKHSKYDATAARALAPPKFNDASDMQMAVDNSGKSSAVKAKKDKSKKRSRSELDDEDDDEDTEEKKEVKAVVQLEEPKKKKAKVVVLASVPAPEKEVGLLGCYGLFR